MSDMSDIDIFCPICRDEMYLDSSEEHDTWRNDSYICSNCDLQKVLFYKILYDDTTFHCMKCCSEQFNTFSAYQEHKCELMSDSD